MSNPVKPASRAGLGIVNPFGEFWTSEVFRNAIDAEDHFRKHCERWPQALRPDWREYRLVPARVTIEEITE